MMPAVLILEVNNPEVSDERLKNILASLSADKPSRVSFKPSNFNVKLYGSNSLLINHGKEFDRK